MIANFFDLPETCPKCGFIGSPRVGPVAPLRVWTDPTYREGGPTLSDGEHLEFRCQRCGFRLTRPTLSEKDPPS